MTKRLSFQITRLLEATDKEGKDWKVVLIQTGWSLNGKYYPSEVLKKAAPLFENANAFIYEFKGKLFNHLPEVIRKILPEGCLKNICGWFDNVKFESFKDLKGNLQEGLTANFHISENAKWLRQYLKDAWDHGKKMLGFSIDGGGDVEKGHREGKQGLIVKDIKAIDEITPVTNPAAGGQPVRLLASKNFYEEEATMEWLKSLYEFAKKFKESLIDGIDSENITDEQEYKLIESIINDDGFLSNDSETKLEEATPFASKMLDRLIELVGKGDKADAIKLLKGLKEKVNNYKPVKEGETEEEKQKRLEEAKKKRTAEEKAAKAEADRKAKLDEIAKVKEELKEMRDEALKSKCSIVLEEKLKASDLFEPIKAKLRKQFEGKIFKTEELEETIKDEKEVLGKLTESGKIKDLGDTKMEVTASGQDKLMAAFDRMFDPEAPVPDSCKDVEGFTSLKEAYRAAQPEDSKITGICRRDSRVPRLRESEGSVFLREAITTSDFSYLLGTSMEKKLVRDYKLVPFMFAPIVTEVGIDNFKLQERIRTGGYSTLPTITDDAAYTDLYEPLDEEATYTATKKGGFVSVSRNTIKNDDLGWVRKIPGKLAKAGKKSLERVVINLLLDNGTYTPTNTTVFSTLFDNYSTNALSYDNLSLARSRIRKKRERGTAQLAGTATGSSSTTLLDSSETFTDDQFNGEYIRLVYGTGAGQIRLISDTAASGSTITVSTAWTTNPSTDTKYEISVASNNDEVIGLDAKYLIHGEETQSMVDSLLNSDMRPDVAEDERNRHKGKLTEIYVPQIEGSTSQYYWYLAVDKSQADIIEIGYVDNQRIPLLMVQDQPALGQVFTNDRLRWKIRHEYGGGITDNAGLDANEATAV